MIELEKLKKYMDSIYPTYLKGQSTLLFELEKIAEQTAKQLNPLDRKAREEAEIYMKIGIYESVNKFFN